MTIKDPVKFRLYDTDLTSVLGILPAKSMNLFLLLNEPGSGEVSIPLNSRASNQMASDMFVETKYRGGVRGGFFVENIGKDFASSGEGESQLMSISGRGALALMDDAIVWNDGTGASTREFIGTRAGILIELIEEAKVRGALLNLDYDFTATDDSDSEAWVDADDEPFSLTVGTSYLDVVRRIAKVGTDFTMTPDGSGNYVLSAYKDGVGQDKSATVYFRVGVNCEEVSSLETGGEIKNALKVKYQGGFTQVQDNASISLRRRREGLYDASYTSRTDNAITFAAAELELRKDPKKQISVIVYDGTGSRVFVDYGLGDRVTLDINGVAVVYRVRGLQLKWDGEKFASVIVDLNSIILENEIRMSQDIAWLKEQWTSAHDAGLLETSYWAAIGAPNTDYLIRDMIMVGTKIYLATSTYLMIYDIVNGGWQNITGGYFTKALAHVDGVIYIGCFHKVIKYTIATGVISEIADVYHSIEPGINGYINSMAVIGTDVYFTGVYETIGTLTTGGVVKYNTLTDTWTDTSEGSGGFSVLMSDGSNIYAGRTELVRKWNGSSWSTLGTYPTGTVSILTLAMYGTNVLAAGASGDIYEWDGASWTLFAEANGSITDIAVYLTDVYATGYFTDRGSYIAKYSGGAWWELESGLDDNGTDLLLYEGSGGVTVYVAGVFETAGGKDAQGIAAYFTSFTALADYLETAARDSFDMAAAIHNAIAKTALVANDEIGFWDNITQRLRKITWSNVLVTLNNLYVALTGNQIIAGIKTFTSQLIAPYLLLGTNTAIFASTSDIEQVAPDGENPTVIQHSYNGIGGLIAFTSEGTKTSPTAVSNNKVLWQIAIKAHDGTDFRDVGRMKFVANQNHSGSGRGTRWEMWNVEDGKTSETLVFTVENDGNVNIGENKRYLINNMPLPVFQRILENNTTLLAGESLVVSSYFKTNGYELEVPTSAEIAII